MKEIAALIVGAGRIAAGYDSPGDARLLTHAHALTATPGFRLLGFVDDVPARAQAAAEKWGGRAFGSLAEAAPEKPDLVVICVPDPLHAKLLRDCLELSPRAVLCEKPLTLQSEESAAICAEYERRGIPLWVNYQRRYDESVVETRRLFETGELGAFLGGTVLYSKGVLHNGSHAVDTLRFLLGEVRGVLATGRREDYSEADPTVAGTLFFERGQVQLVAGDERYFSAFEIDLVFERARYRFFQSGMFLERWLVCDDPIFPGYRELKADPPRETGLSGALAGLTQAIRAFFDGGAAVRLPARSALRTQIVCETLRDARSNEYVAVEER